MSLTISPGTTPDVRIDGTNAGVLSAVPPPMTPAVCPQACIQSRIAAALHGRIFIVVVEAIDDGSDIHKPQHVSRGGHVLTTRATP